MVDAATSQTDAGGPPPGFDWIDPKKRAAAPAGGSSVAPPPGFEPINSAVAAPAAKKTSDKVLVNGKPTPMKSVWSQLYD